MNTPKVSLVIPCWHVAQHIPHVLEDLQSQTFKDFEAIFVNDGDDNQVEAMETIAAKDKRIRIVRLEQNCGLPTARNAGIDMAHAPWIGFADPDDRFGPHYLQSLYDAVDGTGAEMACGGHTLYKVITGKRWSAFFESTTNVPQIMDFAEAYDVMFSTSADGMVWNKLYNSDIMQRNGVRFNEKMLVTEDNPFNLTYYQFINKIGIVRNCEYVYHIHSSGNSHCGYEPLFIKNLLERNKLLEGILYRVGWSNQRIAKQLNRAVTSGSFSMCRSLFSPCSPLTFSEVVKKIQEEILDQPEIVDAILEGNYGRNRIIRLHQWLVRKGNAYLMTLTYKTLFTAKSHFEYFYAKVDPLY